MRHADINLTMSKHTHTLRGQEHEAVAKLPDLTAPDANSQKATGTDDNSVTGKSDLAENLAFLGAGKCSSMQGGAENTPTGAVKNGDCNTPERIRTPNLRFRRPTLYPIELQARHFLSSGTIAGCTRCCQGSPGKNAQKHHPRERPSRPRRPRGYRVMFRLRSSPHTRQPSSEASDRRYPRARGHPYLSQLNGATYPAPMSTRLESGKASRADPT